MKKLLVLSALAILIFIYLFTMQAQAQYVKRDISKIQQGMTADQVRNEMGRPHRLNTYGDTEQWIYHEGAYRDLYIYFENGLYTGYYQRMGEKPRNIP